MQTILIVDDEDAFRRGIAGALADEGYTVLEAQDGLEGVEMATTHVPDLVITDVQMDNMNGFMMVDELRQNEVTSLIPVIIMTGVVSISGAWKTSASVEYLEKPFDLNDLLQLVQKILKK
ncbi:MAG: response regulator [Ignavibacteria bacterium]|nr:response regulator [Ignavibacteria bacterium]